MATGPPLCPVCSDLLFDAFVAPCGHSLCFECKTKIMRASDVPRKCPECRAKVSLYSPNFTTRALIEANYADAHAARKAKTTRGQIDQILRSSTNIQIHKSNHADAFLLLLLHIAQECKSASDTVDRVFACSDTDHILFIAATPNTDAPLTTVVTIQGPYCTLLSAPTCKIHVYSTAQNPLKSAEPDSD